MPFPVEGVCPFSVAIGSAPSGVFDVGLPVLGGAPVEDLFPPAGSTSRRGLLTIGETRDWLLGGAMLAVSTDLEEVTGRLYAEIFAVAEGRHLARIWNYVPDINGSGRGGLENYRVFCRGRSHAFERRYGRGFDAVLPSASAVGGPPGMLSVVFAACSPKPRHVENPLQVPAYRYPREYGPRSPSFSRATIVSNPGETTIFISGTAAISGHATMAPARTGGQLAYALENLRGISLACGLGPDLASDRAARRHFKVYVRNPEEYPSVSALLGRELFRPGDTVTYLHAHICRMQLNVEIESTVRLAGSEQPAQAPS